MNSNDDPLFDVLCERFVEMGEQKAAIHDRGTVAGAMRAAADEIEMGATMPDVTDRADTITIAEERTHAVARKIEYEPRADGRVTRVEWEWDCAQGRYRIVGEEALEDVSVEQPAAECETGP